MMISDGCRRQRDILKFSVTKFIDGLAEESFMVAMPMVGIPVICNDNVGEINFVNRCLVKLEGGPWVSSSWLMVRVE